MDDYGPVRKPPKKAPLLPSVSCGICGRRCTMINLRLCDDCWRVTAWLKPMPIDQLLVLLAEAEVDLNRLQKGIILLEGGT